MNESFEDNCKYEYDINKNVNNIKQKYCLERRHPLLSSTFQISNIDLSSFLVNENEEDPCGEDMDKEHNSYHDKSTVDNCQGKPKQSKLTKKSIKPNQTISERKLLFKQMDNFKNKIKNSLDSSSEEGFGDDELYGEENDDLLSYNDDYASDENYSDTEGINCTKQQYRTTIEPTDSYKKPETNENLLTNQNLNINKDKVRIKKNSFFPKIEPTEHSTNDPSDSDKKLDDEMLEINENLFTDDNLDNGKDKIKIKKKNFLTKIVKSTNGVKTLNKKDDITDTSIAALVAQVKDEVLEPTSCSLSSDINNGQIQNSTTAETYLIDRYKYAVRHIRQGLSVEEACNKYRISKGALLKCLSGGTAPRGKKTRLTEFEENEIVEWLINNKDLKYNEAIHLVFEQVEKIFEQAQRPNPFHNGKPSMDWWYDFLSRHPQIMASKPEWLRRGKVNDQYIRDVQSGKLRCTKFRRALLSAIQYIRSLSDAAQMAAEIDTEDNAFKPTIFASNNNENKILLKKIVEDDEKCLQMNKKIKLKIPKTVRNKTNIINKQRHKDKNGLKSIETRITGTTLNLDACNAVDINNINQKKTRKKYLKIKSRPEVYSKDIDLYGSTKTLSITNNNNHLHNETRALLDKENKHSTENHQDYIDKLVASLISDYEEDNHGLYSKSSSTTCSISTSSLSHTNLKLFNDFDSNHNQFNKSILQSDLINDCCDNNNCSDNCSNVCCSDDLVLGHNLAESFLNEDKYHQNYLITNDDEDDENNYESFKGSFDCPVTSSHLIVADNEDEGEDIDDGHIINGHQGDFRRDNVYSNCLNDNDDNLSEVNEEDENGYEEFEEDEDEEDDDDYDGQTHITTLHEFE